MLNLTPHTITLPISVQYAAPEEAAIFADHLSHLGLPPMDAATSDLPLTWGDYLLDWGVFGARGNPEDRAYLRGIKRMIPGTDPRARRCIGPYIDAAALRDIAA